MKLMLGELANIIQGISAIVEEKLPIKTSYWLTRDADKMTSELKVFETSRQKLLDTYALKDKNGEKILAEDKQSYKMQDIQKFQEEFSKLAETEIDVDLKTFKLSDFGKVDISVSDMVKLKPIIQDFEDDDKKENKSKK